MDNTQTVLTVINNSNWVAKIDHSNLVLTLLESYGMPANVSEQIIFECLHNELIGVGNKKYWLTDKGQRFLDNQQRSNKNTKPVNNPTGFDSKLVWKGLKFMFACILTITLSIIANFIWDNVSKPKQYLNKKAITKDSVMAKSKLQK